MLHLLGQLSLKRLKGFSNERLRPARLSSWWTFTWHWFTIVLQLPQPVICQCGVRGFYSYRKKALISNCTWMAGEGRAWARDVWQLRAKHFCDLPGQHLWHQSLLNKSLNRCKVQESESDWLTDWLAGCLLGCWAVCATHPFSWPKHEANTQIKLDASLPASARGMAHPCASSLAYIFSSWQAEWEGERVSCVLSVLAA